MSGKFKSTATQTAIRLIKLMQLIPRNQPGTRRRIGTQELEKRLAELGFDVSRRTLQRDLQNLMAAFPHLRNDGHQEALGWYWDEKAAEESIPAMDHSVAFSLKMMDKLLRPRLPALMKRLAPYLEAADKLLPFERKKETERIIVVPRSMPLLPVAMDEAVMDVIYQCLVDERQFRARYRRRDGEAAEYVLNAHGLVLRNEVTYLVATAWHYEDPRHYALHRFEKNGLEILDTPAHTPAGFSMAEYVDQGGFLYLRSALPLKISLLMDKNTATHLEETPLSEDQRIEADESGWVRITATVADTEQLRWWILGLGNKAEVERPEALREEIAGILTASLERYQNK
ncbi:MAG TPA: WYL domain-containing transcriptional regulator [Chromatiaceae bacterium]|nr:WYL domain-containing transcriptional regulator [Chromatiaceae bacterium]